MRSILLLAGLLCWSSSILWSFGSRLDGVDIFLEGGIPQVFEGIPASLVCLTSSTYSERIWTKDGTEVARCVDDIIEKGNLPRGVNVSSGYNKESKTLFCVLTFVNLTIPDHNGTYICLGNNSTGLTKSETYNFVIRERKPFCDPPPVEYLLDSLAVFTCHNPAYSFNTTILWLPGNTDDELQTLPLTQYDHTTALYALVQMKSEFNGSVFSCHIFFEEPIETLNDEDSYSCSVGPVFVYDTPFLSIVELNDTGESEKLKTILNCRLVPSNLEAKVRWRSPSSSFPYTISSLEASSNITFSSSEGSQEETIIVTCEGFYEGSNISSVYSLNLSPSSHLVRTISSEDPKPSFLTPLTIVLFALGAFVLIILIVTFCVMILKFNRSEEGTTYENDTSFRKDKKDTGKENDVIELDTNLQRYHPEPFSSSQSIDQRPYDVPPFGSPNNNIHGETNVGGFGINARIYDPGTEETDEYYEMEVDLEDYANIR